MVGVANATGFVTGEFVTINCDIATGTFPKSTDFSVTLVLATDIASGATITALTAGLTADIK